MDSILTKVENFVLKLLIGIDEGNIFLKVPKINSKQLKLNEESFLHVSNTLQHKISLDNTKRIACLIYLLSKCHSLLSRKSFSTMRDIYYGNIDLFGTQVYMNRLLFELCSIFQTTPWNFNVLSTSKSLIFGDLKCLNPLEDEEIDFKSVLNGSLLPNTAHALTDFTTDARVLFIVEKDATFQKLLDSNFYECYKPCLILTGRGNPDLQTRYFLSRLNKQFPHMLLLGLFDPDPFGLNIYTVYKYGSELTILMSENNSNELFALPKMQLLGVLPSDIQQLHVTDTQILTDRDIKLLNNFQNRPYYQSDLLLKKQVECLLKMNKKAEIQSLSSICPDYLTQKYLPMRFSEKMVVPS